MPVSVPDPAGRFVIVEIASRHYIDYRVNSHQNVSTGSGQHCVRGEESVEG